LVGIIGPRGVAKTTLLLQFLKQSSKKYLYFSADDVVFQDLRLYDNSKKNLIPFKISIKQKLYKY